MVRYQTEGVCAKEIQLELEDGKIKHVQFSGGCPGNLSAISKLVEGMSASEVIAKFKGNQCRNGTSCADQLAKALEKELA